MAGRDGLMPHIFSMRHYQSNVPMIAILFEIIISFVFLFFMSNIGKLIICVGMINWTCKSAVLDEFRPQKYLNRYFAGWSCFNCPSLQTSES